MSGSKAKAWLEISMKRLLRGTCSSPVTWTRTPPRNSARRQNWLSMKRKYALGFSTIFFGSTNSVDTKSTSRNSSTSPASIPTVSSGNCHRQARVENPLIAY